MLVCTDFNHASIHYKRRWLHHEQCRLRLYRSCPGDVAAATTRFLLRGSIGRILQEEHGRPSSDWQLVDLAICAYAPTNLRLPLGAWHTQSIVPSFLLSVLMVLGTCWAVHVDHLELHINRLPIVIIVSIPLRPVYQQASHVSTTAAKTFHDCSKHGRKQCVGFTADTVTPGVLGCVHHTQCNAMLSVRRM